MFQLCKSDFAKYKLRTHQPIFSYNLYIFLLNFSRTYLSQIIKILAKNQGQMRYNWFNELKNNKESI